MLLSVPLIYYVQLGAVITQYKEHDSTYITTRSEFKYELEFEHTKDTPYLALTGELWGVFCEDFGKKEYHGTALYLFLFQSHYWPDAAHPV